MINSYSSGQTDNAKLVIDLDKNLMCEGAMQSNCRNFRVTCRINSLD